VTVHFIGAGPGAPISLGCADGISSRVVRMPVCRLARAQGASWILPSGARIVVRAAMSLDEIVAEFKRRPTKSGCRAPPFRRSVDLEFAWRTVATARTLDIRSRYAGRSGLAAAAAAPAKELTLPQVAQSSC